MGLKIPPKTPLKKMGDQSIHTGTIVPIDQLSEQALKGLIEQFILREGTDYGLHEVSLERKHNQVIQELRSGNVFVVFDPAEESCSIVRKESLPNK